MMFCLHNQETKRNTQVQEHIYFLGLLEWKKRPKRSENEAHNSSPILMANVFGIEKVFSFLQQSSDAFLFVLPPFKDKCRQMRDSFEKSTHTVSQQPRSKHQKTREDTQRQGSSKSYSRK
jgi:hypothetical protein